MIVAKLGGSSLKSAECFLRAASVIRKNNVPVVIVSAPGGKEKVTDLLIEAYGNWERTGSCACPAMERVHARFSEIARSIGCDIEPRLKGIEAAINSGCGYDYAVSRGENLSAYLMSSLLGYEFIDAEQCIKLTQGGQVDFESVLAHSVNIKLPCVIPGFYGKLPTGAVKLLPRGGSDISGALVAAALGAEYQKWTDVDGIFDGMGGIIERMSYDEAELLCHFGASVMQYKSMPILKRAKVKLVVRGAFSDSTGTVIGESPCGGFAFSHRTMFLGGTEAKRRRREIEEKGLFFSFDAELLGRSVVLIDDCSFSRKALDRILGGDAHEVTVTAAIGKIPSDFRPGQILFSTPIGTLFVKLTE